MKKVFFLIIILEFSCFVLFGQTKLNPAIKDFGTMFDVPFARDKANPSMKYKIIVESGTPNEKPDSIYPPLEHVSRMYNLHVYSGVKPKNLDIELVIFANPIFVVLNNEAYKKKFGIDNPNLK